MKKLTSMVLATFLLIGCSTIPKANLKAPKVALDDFYQMKVTRDTNTIELDARRNRKRYVESMYKIRSSLEEGGNSTHYLKYSNSKIKGQFPEATESGAPEISLDKIKSVSLDQKGMHMVIAEEDDSINMIADYDVVGENGAIHQYVFILKDYIIKDNGMIYLNKRDPYNYNYPPSMSQDLLPLSDIPKPGD
jgi:hypothetical protein